MNRQLRSGDNYCFFLKSYRIKNSIRGTFLVNIGWLLRIPLERFLIYLQPSWVNNLPRIKGAKEFFGAHTRLQVAGRVEVPRRQERFASRVRLLPDETHILPFISQKKKEEPFEPCIIVCGASFVSVSSVYFYVTKDCFYRFE